MKKPRVRSTIEGVREQLERLEKRAHANPKMTYNVPGFPSSLEGVGYVWLYGVTEHGRGVVLGPYLSESDAEASADDLADYKMYTLPTRSQSKATQMVKAQLRKNGQSTDEAITRKLHRKGLDRVLGRR